MPSFYARFCVDFYWKERFCKIWNCKSRIKYFAMKNSWLYSTVNIQYWSVRPVRHWKMPPEIKDYPTSDSQITIKVLRSHVISLVMARKTELKRIKKMISNLIIYLLRKRIIFHYWNELSSNIPGIYSRKRSVKSIKLS